MKLRNKKTGEIVEGTDILALMATGDYLSLPVYRSLAELNEEWEDYEESKEYWYVSCDGRALKATTDEDDYNEKHIKGHKQIGNYFETQEEAEKAVEKLKAWKRLKDKGFKFEGWVDTNREINDIMFSLLIEHWDDSITDDLTLLFDSENRGNS